MPTQSSRWQVLVNREDRPNEEALVTELQALIAQELNLPKLSASNLFRYAVSKLAEDKGLGHMKMPPLRQGIGGGLIDLTGQAGAAQETGTDDAQTASG